MYVYMSILYTRMIIYCAVEKSRLEAGGLALDEANLLGEVVIRTRTSSCIGIRTEARTTQVRPSVTDRIFYGPLK